MKEIILTTIFSLFCLTVAGQNNQKSTLLGDANGDGKVDVADIVTTVNNILGLDYENFKKEYADINHDGHVDYNDINQIVNYISNHTTKDQKYLFILLQDGSIVPLALADKLRLVFTSSDLLIVLNGLVNKLPLNNIVRFTYDEYDKLSTVKRQTDKEQYYKSINIHYDDTPERLTYDITEIDSITFDEDLLYQRINIEGIKIPYKIEKIDSISFSLSEAPVSYYYIKLIDEDAHYVMNKNGYIRICNDADGLISEIDAYIHDIPLTINLDDNQRIQSIRTDSLDLYYEYQDDVTIAFGQFYSFMICDTIDNSISNNSRRLFTRNGSTSTFWHKILKSVGNKIKDYAVERGINKVLKIELNSNNSYEEEARKAKIRASIKDLMGFAEKIQEVQKFEDMHYVDILNEMNKLPDLGGIENAAYFCQYIDPTGACAKANKWIMPYVKEMQDYNNRIIEQKKKEASRPTLIFNLRTGKAKEVTDNSAICSIEGLIKVVANNGDFNFDYGICYSTSPQPSINKCVKSNISNMYGFEISLINISLPFPYKLISLSPHTTYYYRAFIKDNITGNIIYADDIEQFTTLFMSKATTGECLENSQRSATVSCTYENVPENGICGVKYTWPNGSISKDIGRVEGTQKIQLSSLEPSTDYYYQAFIKIGDEYVMAEETKSFTTKPVLTQLCPDNNHPHLIDLGLPSGTKWSCCNVGASNPEETGGYYAWGETKEKDEYVWENYSHYDQSTYTSYSNSGFINIGSDISNSSYDVAHTEWKESWQMPTAEQYNELINKTTSTWTNQNGVNGMKFIGLNGNSIFIPAAGDKWNKDSFDKGERGSYWSSTQHGAKEAAWCFFVNSEGTSVDANTRYGGMTVRPVQPKIK